VDTLLHGLTPAAIAELTHVSIYTARRWKRGARLPPTARALLELVRGGELGSLARPWRGFRVHGGELWTPHGFSVRPGEIASIPYRFAQIRALERELEEPAQWGLFR
jgi:transcriptional regulator with XRE-family HTH domain